MLRSKGWKWRCWAGVVQCVNKVRDGLDGFVFAGESWHWCHVREEFDCVGYSHSVRGWDRAGVASKVIQGWSYVPTDHTMICT